MMFLTKILHVGQHAHLQAIRGSRLCVFRQVYLPGTYTVANMMTEVCIGFTKILADKKML